MRTWAAAIVTICSGVTAATFAFGQNPGDGAPDGNPTQGGHVFEMCSACHALDRAVVGPPLGDVIGRRAGTVSGYSYSPLMRAAGDAGLVWSRAELVDYLQNPTGFLTAFLKSKGKTAPGSSKMIFKLPGETQRRDVAAYLATAKP